MKDTETLDDVLNGLATHAGWYGFDKAMSTEGAHTSSSPTEALADAKAAIIKLFEKTVESAKPQRQGLDEFSGGFKNGVNQYQQNLLQALSNSGKADHIRLKNT